jgi:hypothetical protein
VPSWKALSGVGGLITSAKVLRVDENLDAILRIGAAVDPVRKESCPSHAPGNLGDVVEVLLALLAIAVPPQRAFGDFVDLMY